MGAIHGKVCEKSISNKESSKHKDPETGLSLAIFQVQKEGSEVGSQEVRRHVFYGIGRGGKGSIIHKVWKELEFWCKFIRKSSCFKYGNDMMLFMFQTHVLTDEWRIDWGGGYNETGQFRRLLHVPCERLEKLS